LEIENIMSLSYKTRDLNEEVNCIDLSLQLVFPAGVIRNYIRGPIIYRAYAYIMPGVVT
jgi:hypothetical protein